MLSIESDLLYISAIWSKAVITARCLFKNSVLSSCDDDRFKCLMPAYSSDLAAVHCFFTQGVSASHDAALFYAAYAWLVIVAACKLHFDIRVKILLSSLSACWGNNEVCCTIVLFIVSTLQSVACKNARLLLELQKCFDGSNDALSTERALYDAVAAWFTADQMSTW